MSTAEITAASAAFDKAVNYQPDLDSPAAKLVMADGVDLAGGFGIDLPRIAAAATAFVTGDFDDDNGRFSDKKGAAADARAAMDSLKYADRALAVEMQPLVAAMERATNDPAFERDLVQAFRPIMEEADRQFEAQKQLLKAKFNVKPDTGEGHGRGGQPSTKPARPTRRED